jgi:hypothetical protein
LFLLFAVTLFTSAGLLFWIQPMFSKMVLPLLGGSPAVWNTSMMFYQGLLLCGYLYAHIIASRLAVRAQAGLHLALLVVAMAVLPVAIPAGWSPPVSEDPIGWLVALLLVAIGAPFFILSSTAPLLQRWFAGLTGPSGRDPYNLYAASNLGSFVALLGFPLLIEPNLGLARQTVAWAVGYVALVILIAVCAVVLWRSRTASAIESPGGRAGETEGRITGRDRLRWVGLAFVPSSMLLGVTTFLTTDVAAVPLLWVVPLALYLLTFVIVFSPRPILKQEYALPIHAGLVTLVVVVTFWDLRGQIWWLFPLHLLVFFFTALVLHGELARSRPTPSRLTEFYLWMAVGGLLGGVFNALVAPVVFDSIVEYEWMMVAACLLRPSEGQTAAAWWVRLRLTVLALVPAILLEGVTRVRAVGQTGWLLVSVAAGLVCTRVSRRTVPFAVSLAAILAASSLFDVDSATLHSGRNFFGAYAVLRDETGPSHMLLHGTTDHGAQFLADDRRLQPTAYYHPNGPAGQVFRALAPRLRGGAIAVVGLGTGTLLCYGTPDQSWTFYEIDPDIERVARNPDYFRFLSECPAEADVVLGDARLSLARASDRRYRLIVLDAFSSDAIPVHLLTREAFELYARRLEDGGILLLNISNRYLNMEPVIAAAAREIGMVGLVGRHEAEGEAMVLDLEYSSDWVVLARDSAELSLIEGPDWELLPRAQVGTAWTDDFSNILGILVR